VSETLRPPCRIIVVDKIDDKVEAVWPEKTDDGRMHYFPCVITGFRGENSELEACVRWDEPGTFKATTWLSLDQIRDRQPFGKATKAAKNTIAKAKARIVKKACAAPLLPWERTTD
jgi:hypothetical protein